MVQLLLPAQSPAGTGVLVTYKVCEYRLRGERGHSHKQAVTKREFITVTSTSKWIPQNHYLFHHSTSSRLVLGLGVSGKDACGPHLISTQKGQKPKRYHWFHSILLCTQIEILSFSDTPSSSEIPCLVSEEGGNHLQKQQLLRALLRYPHSRKSLSLFPSRLSRLSSDNSIACFLVHLARMWDITQHLHDS